MAIAVNEDIQIACSECNNDAVWLSDKVWWCFRCQMGVSNCLYDSTLYNANYCNEYAKRSDTDIGRRITQQRIGLVSTFVPFEKKLLDFGCGTGAFLKEACMHWDCRGAEANDDACTVAASNVRVTVLKQDQWMQVPDGTEQRFDVITFFDSLEHVQDIHRTFDEIYGNLLKEGGIVVVTMPELSSLYVSTTDVAYMQREFSYWRHNKPKEHLTYFTRQGLRQFMQKAGLEIVFETNQESYLRIDPTNLPNNIMTIVGRKPTKPQMDVRPVVSGAEVNGRV
jgi:2-polyprenyl-3-methyl-5-hydroxy-6-metoxy-1,4-benzoquinol methylase